ncbi:NAD(P)H-dependent oxidoreductase [Actinomadura soli]|uniref:NAD(P)H-dependent oxidoreductase n=1 Tax=Actinomadura soli TaxID=2508997 RepID=A0A5C4JHR3_9ACTN|nr:NAD(P)H-dependent oxidoreductase [Actinomadura soli]TMR05707.1 NAD(P)H-dependent oxidoreductase [Actinomadura soli]
MAGDRPLLQVIVGTTRPGRVGERIGRWITERARTFEVFEVELVDLAAVDLPFVDEAAHPAAQRYENGHTKEWSARVAAADAFVFVTAEYNHGFSAPLKNAIDYLMYEWMYKPVGFVSYGGGVAGGTRAVQMLKQVVVSLKMTPALEAVSIPFAHEVLGTADPLDPNEVLDLAATDMLTELSRLEAALRPLRAGVPGTPAGV